MSKLFSSFKIKNMELKNRIVMPPMCMYSAGQDGMANEWHYIHYVTRAVGGSGLILLEATGVESRGRITDHDLGLWEDSQTEGLRRIVESCRQNGAKVGVQLAHAGRKSEVLSERIVAPSPIAFNDHYRVPEEMSLEDIKQVEHAFRDAAKRAETAGFDVIELHAAHGYLINEFLSPITNKRTDEYGGNEENRTRFLKEILKEVRTVWPQDKPVLVRVSAEEYMPEGNHDSVLAEMIRSLKDEGIDLVNVSSGGLADVKVSAYPGYQTRYAETIRKAAAIPVITGGMISSPQMAEEILRNERADLVFLGRELLRDPYWPLHAAKELNASYPWPAPYERAR